VKVVLLDVMRNRLLAAVKGSREPKQSAGAEIERVRLIADHFQRDDQVGSTVKRKRKRGARDPPEFQAAPHIAVIEPKRAETRMLLNARQKKLSNSSTSRSTGLAPATTSLPSVLLETSRSSSGHFSIRCRSTATRAPLCCSISRRGGCRTRSASRRGRS
jgi:hypothetical protein